MKRKNRWMLLLALLCVLALPACSAGGEGDEDFEGTTLIYAILSWEDVDTRSINRFNMSHKKDGVRIEIREYLDEDGRSGIDRLLTEMAAGIVPDIIDLGTSSYGLPYLQLARRGYLEDLWPYIENDPDLGREGVWEAPLKAAEVDGGLYAIFNRVRIRTLVGAESLVGYRHSWTLADLREAFSKMPEGCTVLNYYYTKSDMFSAVFSMSVESYVDWETGTSSFDSERFRSALEFVNSFPDEFYGFDFPDGKERVNEELLDRMIHGEQLLYPRTVTNSREIGSIDYLYGRGGRAVPIGYPTEDGSAGSSFVISGKRLAMSSTCQDKESAWSIIRKTILPKLKNKRTAEYYMWDLFINRSDFDLVKQCNARLPSDFAAMSNCYHNVDDFPFIKGPRHKTRNPSKSELERYEAFINCIDKIDLYDSTLYDLVWEACGPYFAGDKTVDETVQMLTNRVGLYLNEQR